MPRPAARLGAIPLEWIGVDRMTRSRSAGAGMSSGVSVTDSNSEGNGGSRESRRLVTTCCLAAKVATFTIPSAWKLRGRK